MHFEAWIYDLKGVRRQLYTGTSQARAVATLCVAAEIVGFLQLTVTVRVVEVTAMGTESNVPYQRDYADGKLLHGMPPRKIGKELKLALDQ